MPKYVVGHLFETGTCRHAATRGRAYAPRHGHDPRGRAKPAISEPATGLPASNRHRETGERAELGAEGEEAALRGRQEGSASASSSDPLGSAVARARAGSMEFEGLSERGPDVETQGAHNMG